MEGDHRGHSRGTPGRRSDFQHPAGASLQQRHQMRDGNAATGLLAAWLATMVVPCGGIRPRHTGAIDPKGAMTEPASLLERLVWSAVAHRPQPLWKHLQRKLHTGLAIRRGRHGRRGEVASRGTRRMAVKHLDENELSRDDGIKQALSPLIGNVMAGSADGVGFKLTGPILLQRFDDLGNRGWH
jgi:hypothetical protein